MNPAKLSALLWTLCTKINPEGGTHKVPPFLKSIRSCTGRAGACACHWDKWGYALVLPNDISGSIIFEVITE